LFLFLANETRQNVEDEKPNQGKWEKHAQATKCTKEGHSVNEDRATGAQDGAPAKTTVTSHVTPPFLYLELTVFSVTRVCKGSLMAM
jgi:hypothetical protein